MPETTKRLAATFVIRLIGPPELRPQSVPIRPLGRIFNAVQRLIEHTEPDDVTEAESAKEVTQHQPSSIQLLGVRGGSAVYSFAAVDGTSALETLGDMGNNLSNPSEADWDPVSLAAIDEISTAAKSIGVMVEIRREKKNGDVLAKITPTSYAEISEGAFVTGDSSVLGYLERVGGTTDMRCAIRLPNQPERMVYCQVATENVIRQLGRHIYENVRVSGTVTWYRKTWRIKTISVNAFEESKSGSILEALNEIYEAGGKAWDEVEDPDGFIAEMRKS